MRVAVIQSNYIPWRGYFDIIDSVDLFVFYDDLQYTKNDWRNRNRIRTAQGLRWLTVPVNYRKLDSKIDEVSIDYNQKWARAHLHQLEAHYRKAPFYRGTIDSLADILDRDFKSISELNVTLCRWVMQLLDIRTPTVMSRDLGLTGRKTERLIDLLTRVGATHYLSGPSAAAYLDLELFERHGMQLEYKNYDYAPYPHLHAEAPGEASILDLLFNTGPDARRYLKSQTADRIVTGSVAYVEAG